MSAASFRRLRRTIDSEYLRKGYSPKRAAYIGRATAGKVARKKAARRSHRGGWTGENGPLGAPRRRRRPPRRDARGRFTRSRR